MDWCYEAGEPLCEEVRLFLHVLFLEMIVYVFHTGYSPSPHWRIHSRENFHYFRPQKSVPPSTSLLYVGLC